MGLKFMHTLKISMIAPFGMRPKGTLAARMLPLAQALTLRGHRVQIVAPATLNPEDAGSSQTLAGVNILHSRLPRLSGALGVFEQAALLLRLSQAVQPDIVHLFKPKGFGGLAVLANSALPLVVDSDDWEGWGGWNELLPYPQYAKLLFDWQEHDLPRRARAVTVVSRTIERQVRGLGVPTERIFYVPNGSTLARLPDGQRAGGNGKRLLLYSRFWEFSVLDFVQELIAILSQHPEARLCIIGKGEHGEEQELLRLAERAGIYSCIEAYGWVEPECIPDLLSMCDIALVPMQNTLINRARGLAKLLELMQAGLAIVAQNVGQVGEYLQDEQSALLVDANRPGALAMAAIRLLDDDNLQAQLGQGAQRAAQQFAWTNLAGVVEQAYLMAMANG